MANGYPSDIDEAIGLYHASLVYLLDRLVGGRHAAEDLAQDIWLLIHAGKKIYEPGRGSYWTWLTWLARQRAFIHNRRAKNHPSSRLADEMNGPVDPSGRREAAGREAREGLEALPEDDREVIRLYYFEGMSCAEIASAAGCRLGTVHSRLHTARRRLADGLLDPNP